MASHPDQQRPSPTIASFNPSGDPVVAEIKRMTDELIHYVEDNVPPCRRRSKACTDYEQAGMWAVKARTNPDP